MSLSLVCSCVSCPVHFDAEAAAAAGEAGVAGGGLAEEAFRPARERFGAMVAGLASPQAQELTHAELEGQARAGAREVARLAYQGHLDLRAAREVRRAVVTGVDGAARTRAERGRSRQLATVVGPVTVSRIGYRAPGVSMVCPADEQLSLPAEKHSAGLRELAAIEAAGGSFEDGAAAVERATGVRAGKRQIEQLARRAAADFDSFYASRTRPAHEGVLVVEADGKGIKMLPGQLRPRAAAAAARAAPKQQGRLSRGEVATRKRVAEVGTVFDITPAPRTAADILPRPGEARPGEARAGAADAPAAQGKWLTASVAADAAQVIAAAFAEADRRDPDRLRIWVALVDGNKDQIARIHAEARARGIDITIIIDLIHVTEYLWDAAWCFHPHDSPGAAPWVRAHARDILDGHATQVAAAITAQAAATENLTPGQRKTARKTVGYLEAKAPFLDYPTALAQGWPISTGVIEGACRHLVKDRMDITGARWSTPGAEAILKLRAIRANGDWDQYWHWHQQQEHQRTYRNHQNCCQLAA
jgi:hypothetical protein